MLNSSSTISPENENLIFISHILGPNTPAYGNGEKAVFERTKSIASGDSCNQWNMRLNNHLGSHMDFPNHFVVDGKTVEDYRAQDFIFDSVSVAWFESDLDELIDPSRLEKFLLTAKSNTQLLLIRTGIGRYRGSERFWRNGPGVDTGVAGWLRKRFPKLRAIGLDSISLTGFQNREIGRAAHKEFLSGPSPILIIEDLNLEALNGRAPSSVIVLPLRLQGGDGAPCTAIANMN